MYDSFRLMHPTKQEFTWWDYRGSGWKSGKGMRIDQLLVTPNGADIMQEAAIYPEVRDMERPSDHVPYACKLKI
jgi:exodeoxyribonuclease-3